MCLLVSFEIRSIILHKYIFFIFVTTLKLIKMNTVTAPQKIIPLMISQTKVPVPQAAPRFVSVLFLLRWFGWQHGLFFTFQKSGN